MLAASNRAPIWHRAQSSGHSVEGRTQMCWPPSRNTRHASKINFSGCLVAFLCCHFPDGRTSKRFCLTSPLTYDDFFSLIGKSQQHHSQYCITEVESILEVKCVISKSMRRLHVDIRVSPTLHDHVEFFWVVDVVASYQSHRRQSTAVLRAVQPMCELCMVVNILTRLNVQKSELHL